MKTRQFIVMIPLCLLVALPTLAGPKKSKEKNWSTPTVSRGKGVPWTIMCWEVEGLQRLAYAESVADVLKNTKGVRANEVYVNADADGFVRLYYGEYFRKMDTKTGKREVPAKLKDDLAFIKSLGVGTDQAVFRFARMVPKPLPDVGDPAWALTRANGMYTLQVAVFVPTDDFWDFKSAAAEYCSYLREKGYEAYYHHAGGSSIVSVGAFGPQAVITTKSPDGKTDIPIGFSSEVISLQEDELLHYNLVNGAVVRTKNATAQVPLELTYNAGYRNGQKPIGVKKECDVKLSDDQGALMLSRLVYIPGREQPIAR